MSTIYRIILPGLLALTLLTGPASAQIVLQRSVAGGGGATLTDGSLVLNGTAGQPAAGASEAGTLILQSGYQAQAGASAPASVLMDPPLIVQLNPGYLPGETVAVQLYLGDAANDLHVANFYGLSFRLAFDPAVLEFVPGSVAAGAFLSQDDTPLVIEWNTVAGNKRREDVQALVQEQVADFGIRFDINNLDAGELFQNRLPTLDFGMGLYAQVASPDPSVTTIYDRDQIPSEANAFSGQNNIAWDNERVTELARLSDRQLDPDERLATIREIGATVRADMAWIPLYQLPNLTAWRSDRLDGPIGEFTASTYGGFSNMYDWFLKG